MNQRSLLFSIRICSVWVVILSIVILFACDNVIRKVQVRVYDVNTNEGIPNIELFTESGGVYVTDANGCVTIKGEGNLKGQKITTRLSID